MTNQGPCLPAIERSTQRRAEPIRLAARRMGGKTKAIQGPAPYRTRSSYHRGGRNRDDVCGDEWRIGDLQGTPMIIDSHIYITRVSPSGVSVAAVIA